MLVGVSCKKVLKCICIVSYIHTVYIHGRKHIQNHGCVKNIGIHPVLGRF